MNELAEALRAERKRHTLKRVSRAVRECNCGQWYGRETTIAGFATHVAEALIAKVEAAR